MGSVTSVSVSLENLFGSPNTCSTMPAFFRSLAVSFMTSAASFALLLSFHRILAKPSGERIE